MEIELLLSQVTNLAAERAEVSAVALVGSHARDSAGPGSDVDLILLATGPDALLSDPSWVESFGPVEKWQLENWGLCTSLRVFYTGGPEVEFGIVPPEWAALPPDPGTARVVRDGMRILYDPEGLLNRLSETVAGEDS